MVKYNKIVGASGTNIFNGFISEEYNSNLTFPSSMTVYDKMRKGDGTIQSILSALKNPIKSAIWDFHPASDEPKDIEIAEFMEDQFFRNIDWGSFLSHALTEFDFGFSLFEKVYKKEGDKIELAALEPRLQKSIFSWETKNGKKGVTQMAVKDGKYQTLYMDWDKLVHFSVMQEGENYEGVSLLRAPYKHWYYLDGYYQVMAIAAERGGAGIPSIFVPEGVTLDGSDKTEAENTLKNIRANSGAYFIGTKGIKLEFISPKNQWDFKYNIDSQIQSIESAVLGQFLSIGRSMSGGNAQNDGQMDLFFMACRGFANEIANRLTRTVVKDLVRLNWGDRDLPKLVVSNIGERKTAEYAEALKKLTEAGIIEPDENVENISRKILSLPPKEKGEEESGDAGKKKDDGGMPVEDKKGKKDNEVVDKPKEKKKSLSKEVPRMMTLAEESYDIEALRVLMDKGEAALLKALEKYSIAVQEEILNALAETNGTKPAVATGTGKEAVTEAKQVAMDLFESGKTVETKHIGTGRVATPPEQKKVIKRNIEAITTQHKTDLLSGAELAMNRILGQGGTKKEGLKAGQAFMKDFVDNQLQKAASLTTSGSVNNGIGYVQEVHKSMIAVYQYSAILDSRTTTICRSLDKRIAKERKDLPNPPIHGNCRSQIFSILKTQSEIPEINLPPKSIMDGISDNIWQTKMPKEPII